MSLEEIRREVRQVHEELEELQDFEDQEEIPPEDEGKGSYTKDSIFVDLFSKRGRSAMLNVFLGKHYRDLTASQVSELAGINPGTFSRNIDLLLELGIVNQTEEYGNAQAYQLNNENPLAEKLLDLRDEVIFFEGE